MANSILYDVRSLFQLNIIFKDLNMIQTYNKAVFLPKDRLSKVIGKEFVLVFSNHAKLACVNDRYGIIKPVNKLTISEGFIIEVTINEFLNPIKLLLRMRYNETCDVCLVLLPDGLEAIVKTLWLCKATDTHETLDVTKFSTN